MKQKEKTYDDETRMFLSIVYEKYYQGLWKYALTISSNTQQADDSVQETFLRIANKPYIREYSKERLKGYLAITVRNLIYDYSKNFERLVPVEHIETFSYLENSEDEPLIPYTIEQLQSAIARLPRLWMDVVTLHYYHGLEYEKIGKTLGITKNNAYVIAHRARKKLRELLQEEAARSAE